MYLKWIGILFIKLLAWPYSFVIYPIAYYFKDSIRVYKKKCFFLWIVLDDENDYGERFFKPNMKDTFIKAWLWSWVRNNSWNLNKVLTYKLKQEQVVSGYDTSKLNNPLYHCRFKWELYRREFNDYIDGWDMNQGSRLSQKYTNMGRSFCKYKEEGTDGPNFWRSSYAGIKLGWMINYKFGFNDRGEALIDIKIKKFKQSYTEHWM